MDNTNVISEEFKHWQATTILSHEKKIQASKQKQAAKD